MGGGLLAVCAAVATVVAALSGGPAPSAGALPPPQPAAATASASAASTPTGTASPAGPASHATLTGATTPHLIVPDVIASAPGGVTKADLARLRKLGGVRAVLAIDGAKITVNGRQLTVLAAPESALRPWTPPATASDAQLWSDFGAGDLITTAGAGQTAGLVSGSQYPVTAGTRTRLTVGAQAPVGISGVDGIVDQARGRKLGLVRNIAVLVNAPASSPLTLVSEVQHALGDNATVIRLVPAEVSTSLPVDATPSTGRPSSYLQLFQESAAKYCPGLSWTVLAAIGQIESADGQNMGPSTAGALGPMQFLPSTWATWGTDGFGDTGAPNIMNPYDAVPSAARLLCADGAASGGASLRTAIFDYNHAGWYVDEVLTLAGEYAKES
ncbi:MAG TPA: lytic transglycosylase domain-containing protein [Trebonia sp.]|nr:lytic transglycosylase domain-containing protein [Trebonia sp.]